MARLRFEPAGLTFELPVDPVAGLRVLDVCDDYPAADIPYSCRSANCGTCRVRVLAGAAHFAPAGEDELAVLDLFGNLPGERLACQLVMVAEGDATLEAADT
ncbi:MAG: 2Fe-2S iron-sulfur cluster binding domain-containing protein [Myxococcales bacterium]|nr:2Fe-2S iron-sulfur cluster binding domain-containing protein [Myxococcales bacterium]MCB9629218.1 2Fe-2S iron-sulfur cluster binding domain-containing protein [Sandaracinaceae bacterium]